MTDRSHLDALELALSHERARLQNGHWTKAQYEIRQVWIAQREREIAAERKFLGIEAIAALTDDELLAELS